MQIFSVFRIDTDSAVFSSERRPIQIFSVFRIDKYSAVFRRDISLMHKYVQCIKLI